MISPINAFVNNFFAFITHFFLTARISSYILVLRKKVRL
nr:MAG TPA: hypothetical protein [Caudoviricetes sp.]DAR25118.1 MAG TPA: hypothetical protein [Caudoviricetes sp.]DAX78654.1 MAG TPA: hypothetical protein [Caudoviricetes sp.]